jgi:uncharacterized membrane protein
MFIPTSGARWRSLAMAVTWRFVGSLDTFILGFLIVYFTGHQQHLMAAVKVGGALALGETVTKILLFYIHDRIWGTIPWGRPDIQPHIAMPDESHY